MKYLQNYSQRLIARQIDMIMDFSLLQNRKIIDVLIGDAIVYDNYRMPYMSGQNLCEISTAFGLIKTYSWDGGNRSRWQYMEELLEYLNKQNRAGDILSFLFEIKRFTQLEQLGDSSEIQKIYKRIVDGAIKKINAQLFFSKKELSVINGNFAIKNIGEKVVFEIPKVKVVTYQYIRELPDRIKDDLVHENFDSVITKSRTLLEEVLIYIIEDLTQKPYKSNGELIKIYQDATELLNMRQDKVWDKRVNELLGGIHRIVSAISSMRNMNSDAHGVGMGRINIKEREALLVANCSMMLAEYWLSVYENKSK